MFYAWNDRPRTGHVYALPQSPQQFKQLLMVAGVDRYFQIARCYRDENQTSERQPEFTQMDVELSFANADHVCTRANVCIYVDEQVMQLVEDTLAASWPQQEGVAALSRPDFTRRLPRMTYTQAMRDYGCDKPDTRFDMRLHGERVCARCANVSQT
jgi:aspartyl-tRNA synthetase